MSTSKSLRETIESIGGLTAGHHEPHERQYCLLEAKSLWLGLELTDNPEAVVAPDVRGLNDGFCGDDKLLTEQMLRLVPLLERWPSWLAETQSDFLFCVRMRTAREIYSRALGRLFLPEHSESFSRVFSDSSLARALRELGVTLDVFLDGDNICRYLDSFCNPGSMLVGAKEEMQKAISRTYSNGDNEAFGAFLMASACGLHEYNNHVTGGEAAHSQNEEEQEVASAAERRVSNEIMVDVVSIWVEECEKIAGGQA